MKCLRTTRIILAQRDATRVHLGEMRSAFERFGQGDRQAASSIHFPETINPDSAKAEYRNDMLRLTAAIAKAATTKTVETKVLDRRVEL